MHGCEGAENSELRFKLCQDLWDKIKTNTEVRTYINIVAHLTEHNSEKLVKMFIESENILV